MIALALIVAVVGIAALLLIDWRLTQILNSVDDIYARLGDRLPDPGEEQRP